MKKIKYIPFLLLLMCYACKSGNVSGQQDAKKSDSIKEFVLPNIPITYTEPAKRAEYLVMHYWDNFDFSDTAYIHHPEITEQAWTNYINILTYVPLQQARQSMEKMMQQAGQEKKVYVYFTELADKYLYDPNSPYRNEEFYIPVLESMTSTVLLNKVEKINPTFRLELANKNRVGNKAIDFTYTLESGKQGTLYSLSSDYILIYFNNPGCHACEEITQELDKSLRIQYMLSQKKLIILSMYPDENLFEWKNYLNNYPSTWISGYDKDLAIQDKKLYDLKAIPTLYLLDKNKTVLLKDTTVPAIEDYFRNSALESVAGTRLHVQ